MQIFEIADLSGYCYPIKSILGICQNYQHSNRGVLSLNTPIYGKTQLDQFIKKR